MPYMFGGKAESSKNVPPTLSVRRYDLHLACCTCAGPICTAAVPHTTPRLFCGSQAALVAPRPKSTICHRKNCPRIMEKKRVGDCCPGYQPSQLLLPPWLTAETSCVPKSRKVTGNVLLTAPPVAGTRLPCCGARSLRNLRLLIRFARG